MRAGPRPRSDQRGSSWGRPCKLRWPAHRRTTEHVPMCVINGELEHDRGEGRGWRSSWRPVLAEHRPEGGDSGGGWPFRASATSSPDRKCWPCRSWTPPSCLRYPADGDVRKGPVKLKSVDLESGWVAEQHHLEEWADSHHARQAVQGRRGQVELSPLNEDICTVHPTGPALSSPTGWLLKVTLPGRDAAKSEVLDAGSHVAIKVDDLQIRRLDEAGVVRRGDEGGRVDEGEGWLHRRGT